MVSKVSSWKADYSQIVMGLLYKIYISFMMWFFSLNIHLIHTDYNRICTGTTVDETRWSYRNTLCFWIHTHTSGPKSNIVSLNILLGPHYQPNKNKLNECIDCQNFMHWTKEALLKKKKKSIKKDSASKMFNIWPLSNHPGQTSMALYFPSHNVSYTPSSVQ